LAKQAARSIRKTRPAKRSSSSRSGKSVAGREGRGTTRGLMTAEQAAGEFESATSIHLAAVREIVQHEEDPGWDAWRFVFPPGKSMPPRADSTPPTTRRLADAIWLLRNLRVPRREPYPAYEVQCGALELARKIGDLIRELGSLKPTAVDNPTPGERGTARGRMLRWMLFLDSVPNEREPIATFLTRLDATVWIYGISASLLTGEQHRPGKMFGWACRHVAEVLVAAGLVPDGGFDDPRAVELSSLFVAAMNLVPRTKGSHKGRRVHVARLRSRVKQAIYRTL
jgi:hypothetical protein